jgi:hypothetical protein
MTDPFVSLFWFAFPWLTSRQSIQAASWPDDIQLVILIRWVRHDYQCIQRRTQNSPAPASCRLKAPITWPTKSSFGLLHPIIMSVLLSAWCPSSTKKALTATLIDMQQPFQPAMQHYIPSQAQLPVNCWAIQYHHPSNSRKATQYPYLLVTLILPCPPPPTYHQLNKQHLHYPISLGHKQNRLLSH